MRNPGFHIIKCARLNSSAWQDNGRIAAHLSKQARNDNQAGYSLVSFVGASQPTFLTLIEPRAALVLVRDSSPDIFVHYCERHLWCPAPPAAPAGAVRA